METSGTGKSLKRLARILLVIVLAGVTLVTGSSAGARTPANASSVEWLYVYLPAINKGQEEWPFHKTSDGQHPDANEQEMVWLMNHARTNPTQEGIWLATTTENDIAFPRSYFGVSLNVLRSEFAGYAVKPPAAFDVRLYNAAKAHSDDLVARDAQDHVGQFDRVRAAGYSYTHLRGNVFSYSDNSLNAHGGFNIDWGGNANDGDATNDGMQYGRGHRKAIMSLDNEYANVGIAMVAVTAPGKRVGPYVTTGNYGISNTSTANHYNRFIVGTVWQDRNGNGRYNAGEGYGGVTVSVTPGNYYAVTALGGGYAIPILSAGTYTVTFSGAVSGQQQVVVGATSVLVDLKASGAAAAQELLAPPDAPARTPIAPPPGISE